MARALGVTAAPPADAAAVAAHRAWIDAVVADLRAQRGASVVIAGDQQPPVVHALTHALNQALGNVGRTVVHTEPVEARPEDQLASIRALVGDLQCGGAGTPVC